MLHHDTQDRPARLSDREQAVAARFAAGLTYRQIGEELFIAPTTVRTHLSAIYQKLGVRNKIGLAAHLAGNGKDAGRSCRAAGHQASGRCRRAFRRSERRGALDPSCRRHLRGPHRGSGPPPRSVGDRAPHDAFLQGTTRRCAIHRAGVERGLRHRGKPAGGRTAGSKSLCTWLTPAAASPFGVSVMTGRRAISSRSRTALPRAS